MSVSVTRVGRPPKTSREQILDAAALFDSRELQLTTLAEKLGISVKTVYYYFPNRKALLVALTDRAVQQHEPPQFTDTANWEETLRVLGDWTYRIAQEHPNWFVDAPAGTLGLGLRVLDDALSRLLAAGFDEIAALHAYDVVTGYAAAAGQAAHRSQTLGGVGEDNVRRHLDEYASTDVAERATRLLADIDMDTWVAKSLDVVIAGVATMHHSGRTTG